MNAPAPNRIDLKFQELKERGQKAFVAYITAGDPWPAATPALVWALERAGADIVELGVPFSDPLADGVVNQLSAQRALAAGTTPPQVLEIVRAVREKSQIPIVLYTYFNLLYAFGVERFCVQAHEAGVDGVLVLDLPPEEDVGSLGHLSRISLVAPTSPVERIARIVGSATGFVYYVSREGVTGMQTGGDDPQAHVPARLHRFRHLHARTSPHRGAAGRRRRGRERPRKPDRPAGERSRPRAEAGRVCPSAGRGDSQLRPCVLRLWQARNLLN
jgi:tryptophan synthase alpha subunit